MQLDDTPAGQITDAITELRALAEGLDVAAPAELAARKKRLERMATFLEIFVRDEIPASPSLFQSSRPRLNFGDREPDASPFLDPNDPIASPAPANGSRA